MLRLYAGIFCKNCSGRDPWRVNWGLHFLSQGLRRNLTPVYSNVCEAAPIGNLSTRRSWFTNDMAGGAELDRARCLRAKCKSLSKPTWNHHERWQNNSFENVFQIFARSFVSFLRRKHDFGRRISAFVWRILFEEPRIWTSGFNLRTRVLKSVTAAQERLDMRSGCHAAKILPVGVRGTKNICCLSSLISLFWARNRLNELPEMCFKFPSNLTGKSTMAFLTVQSWHVPWPRNKAF